MYIGKQNYRMVNISTQLPHNYISTVDPTIDVNPPVINMTWLNSTSGEVFVCADNTIDNNIWYGQLGSFIVAYNFPVGDVYSHMVFPYYIEGMVVVDGNLITCNSDDDYIRFYNGITTDLNHSMASPSLNPEGLTFDGTNLVVAAGSYVYVMDGLTSTVLTSWYEGVGPLGGIAFDGHNIITINNYNSTIKVHTGVTGAVSTSFSSPSTSPTGIVFDGVNLLSIDDDSDRCYIHDGISATILDSFILPAPNSLGVTYYDDRLYTAYYTDLYIHKKASEV